MKSATCLLLALAFTARAAEPHEPPPASELGRAFVTIPYAELRALWEAGQHRPAPPKEPAPAPVAFLIHRAEVRLQMGESASVIDADFEPEALDAKWQTIPLLGGDVRLDKAEAGERSVIWKDGYVLLTNAPGRTPVTLHLATRGVKQMAAPLKLTLGSAAVKRLIVSGVPAGLEVRANGQRGAMAKDGALVFHLAGAAGEVSVEVGAPKVDADPKPLPPITLSRWQTQSQTLVNFSEGRLHFLSRVFARADDGSGLEMTLALPANAGAISITGDDLAEWTQSRAEDGRRLVLVRWKTRDLLDREVEVTYAVAQSPLAESWTLQAPAAPEDKEARHLYAILPADGLELKSDALRAAVESRRLPDWMRSAIGGAAFVTAEASSPLVLQTHWLPVIATAEAIVSVGRAQLRLVSDGATQTAVSYTIKHQAPLAWRLELPANVELLSCSVGGAPARPIQREGGFIELAIPTAAKGTSEVSLVYAAKAKPLDPVSGEIALELPRTPLFIEHLEWSVVIPSAFEVTAFEGNVFAANAVPEPTRDERVLAFRKDFCRAERPVVSLFYQRRTIEK